MAGAIDRGAYPQAACQRGSVIYAEIARTSGQRIALR